MNDLRYKETKIVTINDQITKDPIVFKVMEYIFEWANEMGLQGKKVKDFRIEYDNGIFKTKIDLKCQLQINEEEK